MLPTLVLIATSALALPQPLQWADLEKNVPFVLDQQIRLTEKFAFDAGTEFELTGSMPLGDIPVYSLDARARECAFPEASAEMVLIDPRPENERDGVDRSVGLILNPGCNLEIYVEYRDLYSRSFFAGHAARSSR